MDDLGLVEAIEAEDRMQLWIETCCAKKPDYWTSTGDLYSKWKEWADASGEYAGSIRAFSQNLEAAGFQPFRKKERGFIGLTIYHREPKKGEAGLPYIWGTGFNWRDQEQDQKPGEVPQSDRPTKPGETAA